MRTPRPWKVTKLAQGQVRERIPPGKVVSELREEMLKDRVKLSGDNGIPDRGTTFTKAVQQETAWYAVRKEISLQN